MGATSGLRVGLAGLRFGAEFVPICLHHPDVAELAVCDSDPDVLAEQGDKFKVARRTTDLTEMIESGDLDAIHLVTPIPLHAEQTLAVLESGKHCACTVPMATGLGDLERIVAAKRASGRKYMMMETAVYTRGFLMARGMLESGEFVRSIVEDREPYSGAATAANWTAAGICAHQSAMTGGERVAIPAFD